MNRKLTEADGGTKGRRWASTRHRRVGPADGERVTPDALPAHGSRFLHPHGVSPSSSLSRRPTVTPFHGSVNFDRNTGITRQGSKARRGLRRDRPLSSSSFESPPTGCLISACRCLRHESRANARMLFFLPRPRSGQPMYLGQLLVSSI